ncbi:hypothetical protein B0H14DRAFT_2720063 [Mycena olivaceomarginata]|nr:hypothetical protein B0H14DRAFT_2720063 [Mycena olivaceomarginata]
MFNNIHSMFPTAAEIASQTLVEENSCRFPSFSASDAVTLGLSIRKRFRGTSRHAKGKGLVISIQSIAGHPLFCCSVGDLGHLSGIGDISLDSWNAVEGMINVVKRTGHSSYYVEKGMAAMGKTPKQMGLQGEFRVNGGAFPIWLEVIREFLRFTRSTTLIWGTITERALLPHRHSRVFFWILSGRSPIGFYDCPRLPPEGQTRFQSH